MERQQIILELENQGVIFDNKLTWQNLCSHTKFDSFMTAFAFGVNWDYDGNLDNLPTSHLKMALFNVTNFPKDNHETK